MKPEPVRKQETVKWVNREIQRQKTLYAERDELILGLRRQRMMRLKPRPTEAYQNFLGKGVRVPVSFRLVETVVGAVAGGNRPAIHVLSPDAELSRRGSRWADLVLKANEQHTQRGMYWKFWDSFIGDGLVFMKTTRHPWTEYPDKEENDSDAGYQRRVEAFLRSPPPAPIRTRVADPATCYPPLHEWTTAYFLESGMRPTTETLRQLGLKVSQRGNIMAQNPEAPTPINMAGLRLGPNIEVDELWTDKDLFVRVGGTLWHFDNELGRIPYVWASGSAVAWSDPTLQAMSVLYPLMYLEPWVNQFLSQLVGSGTSALSPTPIATQEARGNISGGGDVKITDWQGGKLHQMPPGADLKFIAPPLDAQSVNLFNVMVQMAEKYTLSPEPSFAGSRTPGTVMSQVAERVVSILKPRVDMAESLHAEQIKMYLEMVEKTIQLPVHVSGLVFEERSGKGTMAETVLRPSDVKKIRDVQVEIAFKTMQDKIAWNTMSVMMQQSGVWSMDRTRRETGVTDPRAEGEEIDLEKLEGHPLIEMYVMQKAMEGQDPLEALQELQGAAQQAIDGMGSGGPGAGANGSRPTGGRNAGEPRAPGGTRDLTAAGMM